MIRTNRCRHCRRSFIANPRVKKQQYCSRKTCQRARRAAWQKYKMKTDSDYQQNQKDCQSAWRKRHPDYWRNYRRAHPDYCELNRKKQKQRDAKRRVLALAKMDTLKQVKPIIPGSYFLVPILNDLAKMDALTQKIKVIPDSYQDYGSSCKKGLDGSPPTDRLCT